MREITIRIELQDNIEISDFEQMLVKAIDDTGVDCIYEIIE